MSDYKAYKDAMTLADQEYEDEVSGDMQARRDAASRVYNTIPEELRPLCAVLMALHQATLANGPTTDDTYPQRMQTLISSLLFLGVPFDDINVAWSYCLAGIDAAEESG